MAKKNKIVIVKKNKKRSNAAGASKKVNRPSRKNKRAKETVAGQFLQALGASPCDQHTLLSEIRFIC